MRLFKFNAIRFTPDESDSGTNCIGALVGPQISCACWESNRSSSVVNTAYQKKCRAIIFDPPLLHKFLLSRFRQSPTLIVATNVLSSTFDRSTWTFILLACDAVQTEVLEGPTLLMVSPYKSPLTTRGDSLSGISAYLHHNLLWRVRHNYLRKGRHFPADSNLHIYQTKTSNPTLWASVRKKSISKPP